MVAVSLKEVIAGDEEVDEREVQVEEECLKILALHQPVAVDLRRIATVIKVNNDLERIGDLALNIANRLDSLCGLFAVGKAPSGSADPFALRRAALGIVQVLVDVELHIDLRTAIARAAELIDQARKVSGFENRKRLYDEVLEIMANEVPFMYLGSSYRHTAVRKNVSDFRMTPKLDTFDFRWTTVD